MNFHKRHFIEFLYGFAVIDIFQCRIMVFLKMGVMIVVCRLSKKRFHFQSSGQWWCDVGNRQTLWIVKNFGVVLVFGDG